MKFSIKKIAKFIFDKVCGNPIITGATLITLGWLVTIYVWLDNSPSSEKCSSHLPNFLCPLRELELNALGDFLAGTFSVLAFLWLTVAVILQSIELQKQRLEFQEMRQASQDQAATLKIQTEVIMQDRMDQEIEGLMSSLIDIVRENWPTQITLKGKAKFDSILEFKNKLWSVDVAVTQTTEQKLSSMLSHINEICSSEFQNRLGDDVNRAVEHDGKLSIPIFAAKTDEILLKMGSGSIRMQQEQVHADLIKFRSCLLGLIPISSVDSAS